MTEKKEEQPAAMNAFELISMSKGLNLGNLFDVEQVCNLHMVLLFFIIIVYFNLGVSGSMDQ